MSKRLLIDVRAKQELKAAARWYEQQLRGLGAEFIEAVDAALLRVKEKPESGSSIPGVDTNVDARRVLLKRFPYAVVYIELHSEIRVLAFAHTSRRPGYWQDR